MYVTPQLAELAVGVPRVHGEPVKVPVAVVVNATVPVGALATPLVVSVTVAVHVVGELTLTDAGEQSTTVVVACVVTVTEFPPELPA